MANECNYKMVLLSNPNQVDESCMCPECHNNNMDTLQIDTSDNVTCLKCGKQYHV